MLPEAATCSHILMMPQKRRARGERPSLRARLAAKKAIVAANSAVPQRSKQREAQEAVASQRDI